MKVLPALLTDSVYDLFQQIHKCSRYFSYFQIDIADGQFVPNTTVSLDDIAEYVQEENSSEIYHPLVFDFHLMVEDYQSHLEKLVALQRAIPIKSVFIHLGVKPDYKALQKQYDMFTIGLVLNPEDTVTQLTQTTPLKQLRSVQIMSVNPGFQGAPFVQESLNKIDQLREQNYKKEIYLDGGINAKTLPVIMNRANRPDYAGIGSYISKADHLGKRVKEIESFLQ